MLQFLSVFCIFWILAEAQFFDPVLDDGAYLDRIEAQIQAEVETSAAALVQQAGKTEKITKSYISIKLADNVFKALRKLAEAEVQGLGDDVYLPSSRVGRQEASESSGSGSSGTGETAETDQGEAAEEETEKPTTPLNGLSTAVKINQNVFNFIGEAIKTIFKGFTGKKNVERDSVSDEGRTSNNLDTLTEELPKLEKKSYAEQLFGILNLLNTGEKKNLETTKNILRNPLQRIFGIRELSGKNNENLPENSENEAAAILTQHIEQIQKYQPDLLPNLQEGITEPQKFLESMEKVVNGIKRDEFSI